MFAGSKILIQNIWDCSLQDYAGTVRKLDGLRQHRLYPGHGPFLLSETHRHLRRANVQFEDLGVSPNIQ